MALNNPSPYSQLPDENINDLHRKVRKKSVGFKDPKASEIEMFYAKLNKEQRTRLSSILENEVQNQNSSGKKFRYHKNLATSKYNEFLNESDEEEVFKTKPTTKEGKDYQFDFKIDMYRDHIKFNKQGN